MQPFNAILRRILFMVAAAAVLLPCPGATSQISQEGIYPQCGVPPATIDIKITTFTGEWPYGTQYLMDVPFEDYVYGVLMGELGPVVPLGANAGQAWSDQVLQAQAVAARTWGSYWCTKRPVDYSRGVDNGEYDQAYRPNSAEFNEPTKQHYRDVSYAMRSLLLFYDGLLLQGPYGGFLLDAEYRQDVGNPSTSWTSLGYDYLRSVNNPYASALNYGPGWSQLASQGWMNANDHNASWYQTLVHYYTGVTVLNKQAPFNANYWNNTDCSGAPVYSNVTPNIINYDWGTASPLPGTVNADNFCVEWSNTYLNFPYDDWYTFFVIADDGFRLYFDGALILDQWVDQAPTWYSVSVPVTLGRHSLLFRYYERTGDAIARIGWVRGRGMVGSYYDETIPKTDPITAVPLIQRPDPLVQFDWGASSPLDTRQGPRIFEDTFAARWQGHIYVPSCRWIDFTTRSDDGVYVKFDNQTLIDNWTDHGPTTNTASRWVCPGILPLRVRYYENGGGAVVSATWQ